MSGLEISAWSQHYQQFPPLAYLPIIAARIGIMLEDYFTNEHHRPDVQSWFMWIPRTKKDDDVVVENRKVEALSIIGNNIAELVAARQAEEAQGNAS